MDQPKPFQQLPPEHLISKYRKPLPPPPNPLQELTADIALAVEQGYKQERPSTDGAFTWQAQRFSTEVVDFNRFDIIDSDGRVYTLIVNYKEKE